MARRVRVFTPENVYRWRKGINLPGYIVKDHLTAEWGLPQWGLVAWGFPGPPKVLFTFIPYPWEGGFASIGAGQGVGGGGF